MPISAPRPCPHPGCGVLVYGGGCCEKHRRQRQQQQDARRGSAASRGYDARWRKARARFLRLHPLCEECQREGRMVPGTEVDHRIPHRGDQRLFWDESNWQSLCKPHHSAKTARDDGGFGRLVT